MSRQILSSCCLLLLPLAGACTAPPAAERPLSPRSAMGTIVPGVEVFAARPPEDIAGKRVGLITNQTGIDRRGRSSIDRLRGMKQIQLVGLFSPEHGIRGVEDARVASSVDEKTGLPIHSLYGETRKPTSEMLEGIEALVYDIQDLGVRQYTYESTMTLAMEAAAEKGIPFIVLDRPNPVTGTILEGNILEPEFRSFVGIHSVLSRHGLTLGELAQMYNVQREIGADLTVVPVEGWRREMWFDETGLPWVNPSPNIRRLEAAIHYPGAVFFEAVNVSEGRGTPLPFEQIGAPWLDNVALVKAMNALNLPGIRFDPVEIRVDSTARKYPGQTIRGVRFTITDRDRYRPVTASLRMIEAIHRLHPDQLQWSGADAPPPRTLTIERHGGTRKLKEAIESGTVAQLLREWEREQAAFRETRAPYLIYR